MTFLANFEPLRQNARINAISVFLAVALLLGGCAAFGLGGSRTGTAVLAAGLLVAFTTVTIGVRTCSGWITGIDVGVESWISRHRSDGLDIAALVAARICGPAFMTVIGLVAGALLSWRARSVIPGIVVVSTLGAASLANVAIKAIVKRPGPVRQEQRSVQLTQVWRQNHLKSFNVLPEWHLPSQHYAFPSGHVVSSAAILGIVAVCLGMGRSRTVRFWLTGSAVAGALFVACTRVSVGVHWFTDGIGGAMLAGIFVILGASVLAFLSNADPGKRKRYRGRKGIRRLVDRTPDATPAHYDADHFTVFVSPILDQVIGCRVGFLRERGLL